VRDTGIIILSDEVYEHIVFDGRRHESVLRYPGTGATQLRGVELRQDLPLHRLEDRLLHRAAALSAEFRKVHQYNTFCSFAPAQFAFAAMIEAHPEHHRGLGEFYQAKRDHFAAQLRGTRLKPLPVPGGYFQLVDYSAVSDLPIASSAAG
jgi:methionine aminotransferase